MILTIGITVVLMLILLALVQSMRSNMRAELRRLVEEEKAIEEKYLFSKRKNSELKKEIKALEVSLTLHEHNIQSVDIPFEKNPNATESDETMRVSQYMLTHGMLTVEQNENALNKVKNMRMDFIGICLTLGYIDLNKAKGIIKALGLHQSPLSAEK